MFEKRFIWAEGAASNTDNGESWQESVWNPGPGQVKLVTVSALQILFILLLYFFMIILRFVSPAVYQMWFC